MPCSERLIADELARDAEQHGASAGRNEHDGSRVAIDELLQVAAGRQRLAALPAADSLAPAGRERLDEPFVDESVRLKPDPTYDLLFVSLTYVVPGFSWTSSSNVGSGFSRTCGAGKPRFRSASARSMGSRTRRMTSGGLPHSARPSASAFTAFGMILEVCEVHHRVAFDTAGGADRRARRECAFERDGAHQAVLIEIAEGIDGRHGEPGPGQ